MGYQSSNYAANETPIMGRMAHRRKAVRAPNWQARRDLYSCASNAARETLSFGAAIAIAAHSNSDNWAPT